MNTKILCFYLPQFYENEYNNKWWGKGYTDWIASQNAKKLFNNHCQPRIPLGKNYYDLSDENASTLQWQAKLAKKYGIYGFCIYHYWFPNMRLLEKPVEILKNHPEIDIHYTLCWDCKTWKRTWYADKYEEEILVKQEFGDEKVWKKHFEDLIPFFLDCRYIKIDNKPVFHIYRSCEIPCLEQMKEYWNQLAKEHGFAGVFLIVGDVENRRKLQDSKAIDAFYNYEPLHAFYENRNSWYGRCTVIKAGIIKRINKVLHKSFLPDKRSAKGIYRCIEKGNQETKKETFYGVFSDYDDTPRRQLKGAVYKNNRIEYFRKCLDIQYKKSLKQQKEFLYINAWNEWGESAYLEPDETNGYAYLETIKRVLNENE